LWQQLPAAWLAGVLLYLLLGSGVLICFLTEPTLLLVFWYLGPLNGLALFDFTAATPEAVAQGIPWYYLALSLPLLGLTLLARWRQMAG
jgi:hypothetical protein